MRPKIGRKLWSMRDSGSPSPRLIPRPHTDSERRFCARTGKGNSRELCCSDQLSPPSGPVIGAPPDTGHWSSAPEVDFAEVGSGGERTPSDAAEIGFAWSW